MSCWSNQRGCGSAMSTEKQTTVSTFWRNTVKRCNWKFSSLRELYYGSCHMQELICME
ncbi:hypothetical protein AHAS_Ahas11G0137300 [Arachis hypogaea]